MVLDSKTIEINCAIITLRDDGIIHMIMNKDHMVNIDDLKNIVKAVGELGNGKKFPNLIEAGSFTSIDSDARKFSTAEELNIYTIADAFVIRSLPQKLIANFYLKFDKPKLPTRFFDNTSEALQWLKQFVA
jgi:hypothetical protein